MTTTEQTWHKSTCILCESNCGVEIRVEGDQFTRIKGNKAHVGSKGYTCEKALRLNHYQNHAARLTSPMRRKPDGSYEEIDWDTAIAEVANGLKAVTDTYGGQTILRYGGGGQGNHLGGMYGQGVLKALGSRFKSNALAQEKTGEAYVENQLYNAHTRADFEHTEVAIFLGKNPWNSHGFPEARRTLKELSSDPDRTMIVIDPRRTKTAELADIHLQLRPGTDAFCVAAILAVLVRDDLLDHTFLDQHVNDFGPVLEAIERVPLADYADRCDVPLAKLESTARRIGTASTVAIFEDLGIEQAPNSTLVSYLQRLIWILRGSFGRSGGTNPHSSFVPLLSPGRPGMRARTSPVTGSEVIGGLIPCNAIADEILTDHPDRFRAMVIESANPAHSVSDSPRFRKAMRSLDFSVVIDVAMTETASQADYVLPAATQYEKVEAVFFNFEFPNNVFTLRKPILDPEPGTLPEPEMHARIAESLGLYSDADLEPLRAAAQVGRAEFGQAFQALMTEKSQLASVGALILYRTLGPTLPEGLAGAAGLWFMAQLCSLKYPTQIERAGINAEGSASLGDALFDALLDGDDGVVFTSHLHSEAWDLLGFEDATIQANIPELLALLDDLPNQPVSHTSPEFPFILAAGERRAFTANTIFRDPSWRKSDREGALALSPEDAATLNVQNGDLVRLTTKGGTATPSIRIDDGMRPGHISLPNGLGLSYPSATSTSGPLDTGAPSAADATNSGPSAKSEVVGIPVNELTSIGWEDSIAGTPWHKHVPARLEVIQTA